MMFDTSAYYGQPGVLSSPFLQQGLFGHLPGQPGQPIWPTIGGVLGHQQLAGCLTPGLLGYLPGQYASPIWPTIGALGQPQFPSFVPPAFVPGPFGLPTGPTIGGWLGQSLLAAQLGVPVGPFGRTLPFETGLPTMAAPGFGIASQFGLTPQIAGWPQPHLAGTVGRSIIPYQTAVPQMVYAGV